MIFARNAKGQIHNRIKWLGQACFVSLSKQMNDFSEKHHTFFIDGSTTTSTFPLIALVIIQPSSARWAMS